MPPIRDHPEETGHPLTELGRLKQKLRRLIQDKLRERTNNPRAIMWWSKKRYACGVVYRGRQKLVGWPEHIPFANPSDIPGGQAIMTFLLDLWDAGILHLENATEDEVDLAKRCYGAVLPGTPRTLPAPFCWGPFGTNQMGKGKGRFRPAHNPRGLPVRRAHTGPKSKKLILDSDSDVDGDGEITSDEE